MKKIQDNIFISEKETIKDALKKLSKSAKKALLVVDKQRRLLGTLSDGDIRRGILNNKDLGVEITDIYNCNSSFLLKNNFTPEDVKKMMLDKKLTLIPVLNKSKKVVDYITWDEVFSNGRAATVLRKSKRIPVVIMAGGRGERLEPFTKIIPKALIPIGDKPVIEIIINEFRTQGLSNYYVILNHKAQLIESYFKSIKKSYKVNYIEEKKALGTAGGLKLLEKRVEGRFIVSNCDVIVRADFSDVLKHHEKNKAALTVLSSIQHHKIPYGVFDFKKDGHVIDIIEKPEYTFTVNTGVYVMEKEVLKLIPRNEYFDMTDLIRKIKRKKRVVVYPVNDSDYTDMGQWEEYRKAVDKFQLLKG